MTFTNLSGYEKKFNLKRFMQFRKLLKQIAAKQGAKQPVESFDPLNINADDPILQIFAINIHTQTSGNNINSIHKG